MSEEEFPTYIRSGAFSKSQYRLVRAIEEVGEGSSGGKKLLKSEIRQIRAEMQTKQSDSQIAKSLLLLLYINNTRISTKEDISFAFMPAIKLAEGGRTLEDRRTGYIFLQECLPQDHELILLLINTISKDLASKGPLYNILGLNAIIRFPTEQLAQMFLPQLKKKRLVRNEYAIVQIRTICAIRALQARLTESPSPSFADFKSHRSPNMQPDLSVIIQRLRLIHLEVHRYRATSSPGLIQSMDFLLETKDLLPSDIGQIHLDYIRVLAAVVCSSQEGPHIDQCRLILTDFIGSAIRKMISPKGWNSAFILESCRILRQIPGLSNVLSTELLNAIDLILPRHPRFDQKGKGKAKDNNWVSPNDHYTVLGCLSSLPKEIWLDRLHEAQMEVIMSGVGHEDEQIRMKTLRLLASLDPNILRLDFQRHTKSIQDQVHRLHGGKITQDQYHAKRQLHIRRITEILSVRIQEIAANEGTLGDKDDTEPDDVNKITQAVEDLAKDLLDLMGALDDQVQDDTPSTKAVDIDNLISPLSRLVKQGGPRLATTITVVLQSLTDKHIVGPRVTDLIESLKDTTI